MTPKTRFERRFLQLSIEPTARYSGTRIRPQIECPATRSDVRIHAETSSSGAEQGDTPSKGKVMFAIKTFIAACGLAVCLSDFGGIAGGPVAFARPIPARTTTRWI